MTTTEDRVDIFHVALAPPWKAGEPRALRGLSTTGITFFREDDGTLVLNPDGTPKALPDNSAHDLAGLADNPDWKAVVGDVGAAALADALAQKKRADAAEARVADLQPKADALPGMTQRATDAEADATAKGQAIAGLNVQVGTLAQQLQAATDELARLKATPMATAADVAALNARLDALQQAAAPAPAQPDPPAPSPAADPTPAPQEG